MPLPASLPLQGAGSPSHTPCVFRAHPLSCTKARACCLLLAALQVASLEGDNGALTSQLAAATKQVGWGPEPSEW